MNVAIIAVMFLVIWGWLAYEIYNAPTYDENEMPIKDKPVGLFKKTSKRIKRNFHIDNLDEGELYEELYRRNDEKEDVK